MLQSQSELSIQWHKCNFCMPCQYTCQLCFGFFFLYSYHHLGETYGMSMIQLIKVFEEEILKTCTRWYLALQKHKSHGSCYCFLFLISIYYSRYLWKQPFKNTNVLSLKALCMSCTFVCCRLTIPITSNYKTTHSNRRERHLSVCVSRILV